MITKEHYQFIRQHPAFVNLPVELFDKFLKDKLSFLQEIGVSVFSSCLKVMCGLSNMIRRTHFLIWIMSRKTVFSPMEVCFLMSATIIQPALSPMSNISPFLLIYLKNILRRVWISFCLLPSGCRKFWNFRNFVCAML